MRLALGACDTHKPEEQHAQALAQVGRILRVVPEDERLQPKELLAGRIAVRVEAKTGFLRAPAPVAAGPDADVAHHLIAPAEIGRVIRVLLEVIFKGLPIPGVDRQPDFVDDGVVEKRIGRVRRSGRLRDQRDARERTGEKRKESEEPGTFQHDCLRLQDELQAKHLVPERTRRESFRQHGITIALDGLADSVDL